MVVHPVLCRISICWRRFVKRPKLDGAYEIVFRSIRCLIGSFYGTVRARKKQHRVPNPDKINEETYVCVIEFYFPESQSSISEGESVGALRVLDTHAYGSCPKTHTISASIPPIKPVQGKPR